MDAAVIEDKAGAGKGHARLLGLELQLDNVVVPCKAEPAKRSGARPRPRVGVPLRAVHPEIGKSTILGEGALSSNRFVTQGAQSQTTPRAAGAGSSGLFLLPHCTPGTHLSFVHQVDVWTCTHSDRYPSVHQLNGIHARLTESKHTR